MKKVLRLLEENILANPLDLITLCQVIPRTWHSISERKLGLRCAAPLVFQSVFKNVEGKTCKFNIYSLLY